MIKVGDRVQVIGTNRADAHYPGRKDIRGLIGKIKKIHFVDTGGLFACDITNEDKPNKNRTLSEYSFYSVRLKKLKEDK